MKFKHFISATLAVCIIFGTLGGSAFAATAGGADDPLISKSYIDNTYPSLVLAEPSQLLADSLQVLQYKLSQAKQTASNKPAYYALESGGGFTLSAGSSFLILSGSAVVSSCSGTIIDLSTGSTLGSGQSLARSHKYLAAENTTATVTVSEVSKIYTYGSVTVTGGSLCTFTDVTESNWFYDYVVYAVKKGLVNGRSTTVFDPENNMTIAEAIKIAACMHQLYNEGKVTLVSGSPAWYDSYLTYAKQNGIVTKTYSNLDAKITRTEFVSLFYRALPASEFTSKNSVADGSIPDVKMTDANAAEIYAFYRAGILKGSDGYGKFYPATNIRRSEVSAIINRMFETDARVEITLP